MHMCSLAREKGKIRWRSGVGLISSSLSNGSVLMWFLYDGNNVFILN